ncbi:MAG: hypothetical protein EBR82_17200 [Caulobacteraceae bacterium]|nr:hypothetical protein [Caulobacteraceae bacterium]
MTTTVKVRFAAARDTAANWATANSLLSLGEFGYESDTGKLKVGNGSTRWNSLAYFDGSNAETIRDVIGAALGAGTGLQVVVNDPADTITVQLASGYALPRTGTGTPEGAVTAPVGTLFLRTDGGAGTTLYVKETGSGNTGWAAK